MLTHVVLFRFDSPRSAQEACERLNAMRDRIPTLKGIEAGLNIASGDAAFDVGLITRFEDEAGLEAYRVHPVHQEVVAFIQAHATARAVVDYVLG